MVKSAEFGQPCRAPEPGRCRICGGTPFIPDAWTDAERTLCDRPGCVAEAQAEITTHPDEAESLLRPYDGPRYGFAPGRHHRGW